MKYEQSAICKSHRYCSVCRRKNKQGAAYRKSIGQMSNEPLDDFECPVNLPWLPENPTVEELLAFSRLVDEKLVNQFLAVDPVVKVAFTRDMMDRLYARRDEVKALLGEKHIVYRVLREIAVSKDSTTGCSGCKMGRMMHALSSHIDKSTKEDKKKLIDLLDKPIIV